MEALDFKALQARLAYDFREEGLLREALTHPSVAHEHGAAMRHNQRLEFLGDAVLQLVLTAELCRRFPESGEGPMTKARAQMVNRGSLAALARGMDLGAFLVLSRGEERHGGRRRASSLADALEALIGAIYLDRGFEAAQAWVLAHFGPAFGQWDGLPSQDNPKGELQEWLQAEDAEAPRYQVAAVTGPDHDRWYECAVIHRGVELARGHGRSKKEAESQAAAQALAKNRVQRMQPGGLPQPETATTSSAGLATDATRLHDDVRTVT